MGKNSDPILQKFGSIPKSNISTITSGEELSA